MIELESEVVRRARCVSNPLDPGVLSKQAAVHKFLRDDSGIPSAGTRETRGVSITGIVESYFFKHRKFRRKTH